MIAAPEVRVGELPRMGDAINVNFVKLSSPRLQLILSRVCDKLIGTANQLSVADVLSPLGSAI
jgi:hypothetical protein